MLNQGDKAREAFVKSIELLPDSTYAYEARYQIAEEEMQKGDLSAAIDNLRQCLNLLTPSTDDSLREKTLLKLADAYYQHKDYDKARVHLSEALNQFPENRDIAVVLDRLGESYRKLAEHRTTTPRKPRRRKPRNITRAKCASGSIRH